MKNYQKTWDHYEYQGTAENYRRHSDRAGTIIKLQLLTAQDEAYLRR